jgi:hypothetical protein
VYDAAEQTRTLSNCQQAKGLSPSMNEAKMN